MGHGRLQRRILHERDGRVQHRRRVPVSLGRREQARGTTEAEQPGNRHGQHRGLQPRPDRGVRVRHLQGGRPPHDEAVRDGPCAIWYPKQRYCAGM